MTMGFGAELARRISDVEREVRRLRSGLIRQGTVKTVDSSLGTVTVRYPNGIESAPMPWFQRGAEHRPPTTGEQAVVLDPSLQGTASIAITGHPSVATPPAAGGGDRHVLHHDAEGSYLDAWQDGVRTISAKEFVVTSESATLDSSDVRLGTSANDFVALASLTDSFVAALDSVFRSWTPAPQDGGAALKAAFMSAFAQPPRSVAASEVRAK